MAECRGQRTGGQCRRRVAPLLPVLSLLQTLEIRRIPIRASERRMQAMREAAPCNRFRLKHSATVARRCRTVDDPRQKQRKPCERYENCQQNRQVVRITEQGCFGPAVGLGSRVRRSARRGMAGRRFNTANRR